MCARTVLFCKIPTVSVHTFCVSALAEKRLTFDCSLFLIAKKKRAWQTTIPYRFFVCWPQVMLFCSEGKQRYSVYIIFLQIFFFFGADSNRHYSCCVFQFFIYSEMLNSKLMLLFYAAGFMLVRYTYFILISRKL